MTDGLAANANRAPAEEQPDDQVGAAHAPWREWNIIGALVFGCFLGTIVQTIVVPIQADLPRLVGADRELTAWVVTATIASACAFSPVTGRLGDLYGRRRIVLVLLSFLLAGSALCGATNSVGLLIAGRALQGAAIGLIPLSMSIMKDAVTPRRLPLAYALTAGTMGIGAAFGIPIGTAIVALLDWHALFWLCLILGAVCVPWVWWAVPASGPRAPGTFDLVGAVANVTGAVALIAGLSIALTRGWTDRTTLIVLGVGIIALLAAFQHMARSSSPLLDVGVARRRGVLLTNLVSALLNFGLMTMLVVFPQLLILPKGEGSGLGITAGNASLIMMSSGLAQLLVTPVSARLGRSVAPGTVLAGSGVLLSMSLALAVFSLNSVWAVLLVVVLGGMAGGAGFAAIPRMIASAVPAKDIAAANGLNAQIRMFGTASAASVVGAILATWSDNGVPTTFGFTIAIVAATGASAVAALLGFAIPKR